MSLHSILTTQSAVETINYATPLLIAVYYLGATLKAACVVSTEPPRQLPKSRRALILVFHLVILICYIAQSVCFLPTFTFTPDDELIHTLSQTLVWICLSLLRLNTTAASPRIYVLTPALNLVLEALVYILRIFTHDNHGLERQNTLQVLRVLTLAALTILTALSALPFIESEAPVSNGEVQSLLKHDANSSVGSETTTLHYDTLHDEEVGSISEHWDSSSDDGSSIDSDEDDKELQEIQKQRLRETGGWIGYLKTFSVFLPYIYPKHNVRLKFYLVVMLINTIAQRALRVLHPRQLGIIIDVLTNEKRMPWGEIVLFIVYEIAKSDFGGLGVISEMLKNRVSTWSGQQISVAALDHVMSLSMNFHDQKDSGEIIKAIEQAKSINSVLEAFLLEILPGAIDMLVAMWYVTVLFDAYALLIVVSVSITFVFSTYYCSIFTSSARRIASRQEREQSKMIYESVSNWFTITCLNRRRYTMSRLGHQIQQTAHAMLRTDDLYTYMFVAQEQAEILGRLAVSLLAAYRVVNGVSSVGDFVAIDNYWENLMLPLYILGRSYRNINSQIIDSERLLQLFQQQPTVKESFGARTVDQVEGQVCFDHVEFAYPGRKPVLRDFNLIANPGEMVAIVGETGSGKSTVLKLLMRFYDVTSGAITIDGRDIRDLTLQSLRESFGFVPQDTVLFNMSILDNIRYGNTAATDEQVISACCAACIHDKILTFPNGYASKVGERGVKLSGGERQRLAIARVFLKNPQIVVLDEATSAMDSQTEAKIQAALKNLIHGRTTFVIAHRLSTIIEADRILVVHEGRVVESGFHRELLELKGRYYELWTKQSTIVPSQGNFDLGIGV